ncbi:hypothetical protein ACQ4LE_000278 [Meloidogyne hapla]|uniref:Spindle and centriole-associated protein 1 n=1 Tax=Meloidogyne hapla TaxID=6305 RepID=A0A1I8BZ71_MELHA
MSVQALLSEVRPNLEILQAIKAADHLFYKDKAHYVDLQPIFTSNKGKIEGSDEGGHKDSQTKPGKKSVETVKAKESGKKEKAMVQNVKTEKIESKIIKKEKMEVQNVKEEKADVQIVKKQKEHTFADSGNATSKLQQVIQQAQKTIENALNTGSNSSISIMEPQSSTTEELKRLRMENAVLCKKLEIQERTINRLEKITQKLLQNSGMTEADLSD